jgi:putative membrane protein
MTTDAWLAIAHHVAVFGLLAVLAAEWGAVRPGLDADGARRVARIDALYGGFAAAVVAVGVSRLVWGAKPADFYLENPVFWLKMAAIAAVGATSIAPTMRYLRWRAASEAPPAAEVDATRRAIRVQLAVFVAIPVFAALMARGIGT